MGFKGLNARDTLDFWNLNRRLPDCLLTDSLYIHKRNLLRPLIVAFGPPPPLMKFNKFRVRLAVSITMVKHTVRVLTYLDEKHT